ncbi:MAG: signal peptide peptidase SppA [Acidobacteria bacterium]|nr:signal peptide peptidase SppA [Acidobacteriota bacterium]
MAVRVGRAILILILLLVVALVIIGQWSQRIPAQTVLRLTLDKPVAEEDWPDLSARFWEGEVTVLRDLLEALDRAKRDDRIVGVSLEIDEAQMNFGKLQELRTKLADFVASGKFCTAYLEESSNRSYYLASACPEVYLTPTSGVFLTGLMGHSTFLRGTLDKLHIYPDLYGIAEYKTARNVFTEKKYTPAHREVVTSVVTAWQQQMVEGIARGRSLQPEVVEQLLREGPFLADKAVEKKLVDKLLYYDQYRDLLKQKAGSDELNTMNAEAYAERSREATGPKIAIVHATGTILTGRSGYDPSAGRYLGSTTIAEALRAARDDDSIKAIVFRVDSPGGSAVASEIIRREVIRAKEKKPVVVSMSDVAASGGYWISMSANKIVADPGTLTGSIGVVFGKMNVKGFYELLGMTKDYVALTPNATLFYPFENFTPEQREQVKEFMQYIYDNFLDGVSNGRGLPREEVHRIAKGRVWLGSQALELKLVDELGGLEQAVALAKQLAQIPPDQAVQYEIFPRGKTAWEQIQEFFQVRSGVVLPTPRNLLDSPAVRLWREPVVLMPYEIEAR